MRVLVLCFLSSFASCFASSWLAISASKQIIVLPHPVSFFEAGFLCQKFDAKLVQFRSLLELESFAKELALVTNYASSSYLIAAHRKEKDYFRWPNGKSAPYVLNRLIDASNHSDFNCASISIQISARSAISSSFVTNRCDESRKAICEKSTTGGNLLIRLLNPVVLSIAAFVINFLLLLLSIGLIVFLKSKTNKEI